MLDFGVARATDADLLTGAGLTQTGQLLGTPSYMSPEQVTADPAAIDQRADVYALGVILFELAGPPPALSAGEPTPGRGRPADPGAGPAAARLAQPGTARRRRDDRGQGAGEGPARRYPSAADLAADLRRWLAHEPIRARRVGPAARLVVVPTPPRDGVSPLATLALVVLTSLPPGDLEVARGRGHRPVRDPGPEAGRGAPPGARRSYAATSPGAAGL